MGAYFGTYDEVTLTLEALQCSGRISLQTVVDTVTRLVPNGNQVRFDEEFLIASKHLATLSVLNGREEHCNSQSRRHLGAGERQREARGAKE